MNETMQRDFKVITNPTVARKLCKKGFYIVDIKKLKGSVDGTAFIFNNTPEFQTALGEIVAEKKKNAEATE